MTLHTFGRRGGLSFHVLDMHTVYSSSAVCKTFPDSPESLNIPRGSSETALTDASIPCLRGYRDAPASSTAPSRYRL
jgi:hypothetical protein